MKDNRRNIAVVFFSRAGQNYSNGSIVDLKIGNTAIAAKKIAALTDAPAFELKPKRDYPFVYSG
ncbi:MAG: flavodoxin, partial [Eubacteriales bacterium]|nr:flavodoxin [Eubacteriales bacterium]